MISIVITNHNYSRYLNAAIDSALAQPDSQVIVVDDGSTDASPAMIRAYGNRVTSIFKMQGGQASAFNVGWEQCRGDVVIFLDADDVLCPNIAQRVAETFRAQPTAAKVQYRMDVIDSHGNLTGEIKPAPHLPLRHGDLRRHILNFPDDLTWMATSGNAFAASVLQKIFPIPESEYGAVGADWYVSHLAPLFGLVVTLDDIGAHYRVHAGNNYENAAPVIDVARIRQTIRYAHRTHRHLQKFARQLGLRAPREILSVSDVANRMISVRLDAAHHPLPENRYQLFWRGARAALRRFDVAPSMRGLFIAWFALMTIAPQPAARWLAEKFLFPATRGNFNRWLGAQHLAGVRD